MTATQSPSGSADAPPNGPDWAAQATDIVVNLVQQVRERTTRPALLVARAVVFGLLALVLGMVAAVLAIAGLVRFVNSYLPEGVWATYLLLGGIFSLAGLLLWTRRRSPSDAGR